MDELPDPLDGRVALVTGVGRGTGQAVALGLAGARVAVLSRSADQVDQVDQAVALAAKQGGATLGVPADVTQPDQVAAALEALVDTSGRGQLRPGLPDHPERSAASLLTHVPGGDSSQVWTATAP